jgi:hypothetical protein
LDDIGHSMRLTVDPKLRKNLVLALRIAMVGYFALWVGFLPLLQVVHVLTSDHGHRYCQEHHQIEDVARSGVAADIERESRPADASLLADTRPTPSQKHNCCSVLNQKASRYCFDLAGLPVAGRIDFGVGCRHTFCVLESSFFRPLLFEAPKTSPPLVAA